MSKRPSCGDTSSAKGLRPALASMATRFLPDADQLSSRRKLSEKRAQMGQSYPSEK